MDIDLQLIRNLGSNVMGAYVSDCRVVAVNQADVDNANNAANTLSESRRIYLDQNEQSVGIEMYDAYHKTFVRYRGFEITQTVSAHTLLSDEYLHLMTTTTPFYRFSTTLTIYARMQIWSFKDRELVSVIPILTPDVITHFDLNRKLIVKIRFYGPEIYQDRGNVLCAYSYGIPNVQIFPNHLQIIAHNYGNYIFYDSRNCKTIHYDGTNTTLDVEPGYDIYYPGRREAYTIVGNRLKNVAIPNSSRRDMQERSVYHTHN